MGKQGRHQKNIKKEKAKVKFKVGKTLPKGRNITDTSFNVKKILIKEQLKSGSVEPVTKRNLSLKETLSRLQHHNTNIKLDNLNGLKEILSKNQELMLGNVSSILEVLADLITDTESSVRKEAISQLTSLIGKISAAKLSPFVCLICSYLGAALSHINKDVQTDALLLVNGLLSVPRFPELILSTYPVSPSSSHPFFLILQGLLNQISQQRENIGKHTGWERKLNIDPEAKLADAQRRIKVLQQLRSLLRSAINKMNEANVQGNSKNVSQVLTWQNVAKAGSYVALNEPSYSFPCCTLIPRTSSYSVNAKKTSSHDPLAEELQLKELTIALVPLLMESWKEVAPTKTGNSEQDLTADDAELLKLILELIFILLEAMKLCRKDSVDSGNLVHWFKETFSKQLFCILMPSFPFSCRADDKKRSKRKVKELSCWMVEDVESSELLEKGYSGFESKVSATCLEQNLLIAQLFCSLVLMKNPERKDKGLPSLQNYLDKVLTFLRSAIENAALCHQYEKQIYTITWTLLISGRLYHGNGENLKMNIKKIEPIINCLAARKPKECSPRGNACASKCLLFQLLCNIIKERELEELQRLKSVEAWIQELPKILPLSDYESIKVLSDMARQCNLSIFHSMLKILLPKIYFLLKTDYAEKIEELKALLALLHWVRGWNYEELMNLGEIVQSFPKETSPLIYTFRDRTNYQGKDSKFSLLLDSIPWWQKINNI